MENQRVRTGIKLNWTRCRSDVAAKCARGRARGGACLNPCVVRARGAALTPAACQQRSFYSVYELSPLQVSAKSSILPRQQGSELRVTMRFLAKAQAGNLGKPLTQSGAPPAPERPRMSSRPMNTEQGLPVGTERGVPLPGGGAGVTREETA